KAMGCGAAAGADASSKTMSPPVGWENSFGNERMTPLQTRGAGVAAVGYASKIAASSFDPVRAPAPLANSWLASIAPQTTPARPSTRTQSRRHCGDPLAGAPRAGDGRLVPARLLACGSKRVAPAFPPIGRQWHSGATLAAYSCGGSRRFEARDPPPRALFTPPVPPGPQPAPHPPATDAT